MCQEVVHEEQTKDALDIGDRYVGCTVKILAPELMPFKVLNSLYYKRLFTKGLG